MIRLLRHVWWWLTKGYTCDDCGRWTRRWRGKAYVLWRTKSVPLDHTGKRRAPGSFLALFCPECTAAYWLVKIAAAAKSTAAACYKLVETMKKLRGKTDDTAS